MKVEFSRHIFEKCSNLPLRLSHRPYPTSTFWGYGDQPSKLRVQLTAVSSSIKMLTVPNHRTRHGYPHSDIILSVVNIARLYLIRKKCNKVGNVRITWHWSAFVQSLWQWKISEDFIFWMCICSLRYPACNAHAPYFLLWPVRFYKIFVHYFINDTIL